MYCPGCGNEITVELKYCNRCGANLSSFSGSPQPHVVVPVKLTAPTIVIGLTITVGLGIIFSSVIELAKNGVHPAFITWMLLFGMAALFGCSAMLIRFWSKMVGLAALGKPEALPQSPRPNAERILPQQLPPRYEPVPSVTEHTTRTFTPAFRDPSERGQH